jgi:hypothetical protein
VPESGWTPLLHEDNPIINKRKISNLDIIAGLFIRWYLHSWFDPPRREIPLYQIEGAIYSPSSVFLFSAPLKPAFNDIYEGGVS